MAGPALVHQKSPQVLNCYPTGGRGLSELRYLNKKRNLMPATGRNKLVAKVKEEMAR